MNRTEKTELTVLCLVEDGNKVLLQNRVKDSWRGYTFPGGHVEPGEAAAQAVIREMKEETGLDIRFPYLVGIKDFPIGNGTGKGRYIVLLYKTATFAGEIKSSPEGEISWVDRDDLPYLDVVEDFFETLKVMDGPGISELFYLNSSDHSTYRYM
uniref:NUDIX hydrolase n=1 Tax=uncultured bacterium Contig1758 TaxID=1393501 RepID=W0FP80_9BACT|nr:NUDIX hydrolase [uncultured bacterium Contig1758]